MTLSKNLWGRNVNSGGGLKPPFTYPSSVRRRPRRRPRVGYVEVGVPSLLVRCYPTPFKRSRGGAVYYTAVWYTVTTTLLYATTTHEAMARHHDLESHRRRPRPRRRPQSPWTRLHVRGSRRCSRARRRVHRCLHCQALRRHGLCCRPRHGAVQVCPCDADPDADPASVTSRSACPPHSPDVTRLRSNVREGEQCTIQLFGIP